jgi:inosine/xanthosine triphosphatase
MLVLVGSTNPVKIEATKAAFSRYFKNVEVRGVPTESGVPHQPIGRETFQGAENRVRALDDFDAKHNIAADYMVGIEGGIIKMDGRWFSLGCMCILDQDKKIAFGTSPLFLLPKFMVRDLLQGKELGIITDELTGETNSKQKAGAIGWFTNNVMSRQELYTAGLLVTLAPLIRKDLFFDHQKK